MAYDIKLAEVGHNKILTIRAMRSAFPPMGLYEAKSAVDRAPEFIAHNVPLFEVERIKQHFSGVAFLDITEADDPETPQITKVHLNLPQDYPAWTNIADLKLGEVVSIAVPAVSRHSDLRIITERGAMNFDGKIFSDGASYQRLPVGTKVVITIS